VARLKASQDEDCDDWAMLLLDQAMLAEGSNLADSASCVKRMNRLLLKA